MTNSTFRNLSPGPSFGRLFVENKRMCYRDETTWRILLMLFSYGYWNHCRGIYVWRGKWIHVPFCWHLLEGETYPIRSCKWKGTSISHFKGNANIYRLTLPFQRKEWKHLQDTSNREVPVKVGLLEFISKYRLNLKLCKQSN